MCEEKESALSNMIPRYLTSLCSTNIPQSVTMCSLQSYSGATMYSSFRIRPPLTYLRFTELSLSISCKLLYLSSNIEKCGHTSYKSKYTFIFVFNWTQWTKKGVLRLGII